MRVGQRCGHVQPEVAVVLNLCFTDHYDCVIASLYCVFVQYGIEGWVKVFTQILKKRKEKDAACLSGEDKKRQALSFEKWEGNE